MIIRLGSIGSSNDDLQCDIHYCILNLHDALDTHKGLSEKAITALIAELKAINIPWYFRYTENTTDEDIVNYLSYRVLKPEKAMLSKGNFVFTNDRMRIVFPDTQNTYSVWGIHRATNKSSKHANKYDLWYLLKDIVTEFNIILDKYSNNKVRMSVRCDVDALFPYKAERALERDALNKVFENKDIYDKHLVADWMAIMLLNLTKYE